MRKTNSSIPTLIIALVCIAVYVTALLLAAYRFYGNVTERRIIAEREFYDLADLASAAGVLGFMDTPFQEAIRDGLTKSQTLEAVIISGPSGEYAFERERGKIVRWEGDSPRFIRSFGVSSTPFIPLRINGLRNVNISAGFRSVDYDYGITILKHTLLIILSALGVAFLTLIIESALTKDKAKVQTPEVKEPPKENWNSDFTYEVSNDTLDFSDIPETGAQTGTAVPLNNEEAYSPQGNFPQGSGESGDFAGFEDGNFISDEDFTGGSTGEIDFPEEDFSGILTNEDLASDDLSSDDLSSDDLSSDDLASDDLAPDDFSFEGDDAQPQGLYSPRSNIGWEDYTNDRLESELHRCATFEQDLVLMAIAYTEPGSSPDEKYKHLADTAVNFFNLRDLIFEKGDQGISVILPNADLDQGFAEAEEFDNHLATAFGSSSDFRIGISSRAGRLVDAERLLKEAGEALNKAMQDPVSPIVAFKSDPEKYRAFIRSQRS